MNNHLFFTVSCLLLLPTLSPTDVDDTLNQACFYVGLTLSDTFVVSVTLRFCAKCKRHSMLEMTAFESRLSETVPTMTLRYQ